MSGCEQALANLAAGIGTTFLLVAAIAVGSALGYLSPEFGERLGGYVDHTILLRGHLPSA